MARSNGARARRHRVAIVGGGFGGLFAARALSGAEVKATVIDRTNHHLFQPLLCRVATGILSEGEIAPPIRDILRRQPNAGVLLGEVVDIEVGTRRLVEDTLDRRTAFPCDSLIGAAGASQSYFGHPEFAVEAPGMKTVDRALPRHSTAMPNVPVGDLGPGAGIDWWNDRAKALSSRPYHAEDISRRPRP